ncbi:unnamed protein product, partial [Mesorhabditis spiculigera]
MCLTRTYFCFSSYKIPDGEHYPKDRGAAEAGRDLTTDYTGWEEFAGYICEMNRKCRNQVKDGEYIFFALKKDTMDTPNWKSTVRICCLKMDEKSNNVKSYRLFNLTGFGTSTDRI